MGDWSGKLGAGVGVGKDEGKCCGHNSVKLGCQSSRRFVE